ncbi:MAG: hypothetical protein OXI95_08855 [bacterium]|nr:hypothetical protein [bacterium]
MSAWGSATTARLEELTRTLLEAGLGGDAITYRIAIAEGDDGAIVASLSDIAVGDATTPLVVDDVAVTWRPAGDRLYTATLTIPAVSVLNDEGDTIASLTAGGGKLNLLVHIDTGLLKSGTMDATGVTVSLAGGATMVRIDHLAASVIPEETAPATWAGQAQLDLVGLAVTGDDGTAVALTRGRAAGWFRDIPATPVLGSLPEGASLRGEVALEDLSAAGGSGLRAGMESSLLEFTVAGTGGDLGSIALRYSHEGLALEDAGLAPVVPRSLAGDVNLDAVPVADLVAAFDRPFASSLPEGATLGLELDWTWPDGAGNASGRLASAPLAPVPATGTVRFITGGMADLVENVIAAAHAGNRQASHLVTYLALFRAMGRHDETQAEPRLVHDIELLPDNRILVNDNDINILLSLLGAD